MLLLNRKDLAGAFTLPMVITTVEQTFQDYHKRASKIYCDVIAKGRLVTDSYNNSVCDRHLVGIQKLEGGF
jgi:hypothetical protein